VWAALLAQVNITGGVRLLGVSVSGLSKGAARQLSLNLDSSSAAVERSNGPGPDSAWEEATHAVDLVRRRFGPGALGPAALLGDKGLSFKRSGDQEWGPDA
jgi:hypothetical protein